MMFIQPDWPAPVNVRALTTTRQGGVSHGAYASLNLSTRVGDNPQCVAENIDNLMTELQLPTLPLWLTQIHGTTVVNAEQSLPFVEADASYTQKANTVCTILTADCLPLLICDRAGTTVTAIHAGWRGLANGIIEATLGHLTQTLALSTADLLVWLGPAIGPTVYEVDEPVYMAFTQQDRAAESAFTPTQEGHWLANLYLLARQRLAKLGITQIYGGNYCTFTEQDKFYSFRRAALHQEPTGRMASLIWIMP